MKATRTRLNVLLELATIVSLACFDQAPFAFNGTIGTTAIKYFKK